MGSPRAQVEPCRPHLRMMRRLDGEHAQLVAHGNRGRQTREVRDFLQDGAGRDAVGHAGEQRMAQGDDTGAELVMPGAGERSTGSPASGKCLALKREIVGFDRPVRSASSLLLSEFSPSLNARSTDSTSRHGRHEPHVARRSLNVLVLVFRSTAVSLAMEPLSAYFRI